MGLDWRRFAISICSLGSAFAIAAHELYTKKHVCSFHLSTFCCQINNDAAGQNNKSVFKCVRVVTKCLITALL